MIISERTDLNIQNVGPDIPTSINVSPTASELKSQMSEKLAN